jgi:hypothetical protein
MLTVATARSAVSVVLLGGVVAEKDETPRRKRL